jgi:hypothetical protein
MEIDETPSLTDNEPEDNNDGDKTNAHSPRLLPFPNFFISVVFPDLYASSSPSPTPESNDAPRPLGADVIDLTNEDEDHPVNSGSIQNTSKVHGFWGSLTNGEVIDLDAACNEPHQISA